MTSSFCIQTTPEYPRCHAPSICESPDGGLLACCFAGQQKEGTPEQVILGVHRGARGGEWSNPATWVHVPRRAAGNPRVFRAPAPAGARALERAEEIWLVAPITYGQWCSGGTLLCMKRSRDGGRAWTDLEVLWEQKGILGKNKPLVEGGFCLLPVEEEISWNPKFLRTEDAGQSWELVGDLGREAGKRLDQPTVVRLKDRTLMAYMRSQENYIYMSYSWDDGKSWSLAQPTALPNNNSGIDMVRLRSGNLVLVYNPTHLTGAPGDLDPGLPLGTMAGFDSWGPRTPLRVSLSTDEGRSWGHSIDLEAGPGVFCYPAVIQASDQSIHVVYTHQRTAIRHVQLEEKELLRS